MNEKKGILQSIEYTGDYNGMHGVLHQYWVKFDNGDEGRYNSNKYSSVEQLQKFWKVNDVMTYEYHSGQIAQIKKPKKFVPIEQAPQASTPNQSQPTPSYSRMDLQIVRQSSLKVALEMYSQSEHVPTKEGVMIAADIFTKWVLGEIPTPTSIPDHK